MALMRIKNSERTVTKNRTRFVKLAIRLKHPEKTTKVIMRGN